MMMSEKKKRLEKFLGEKIRVRFKSPSGRIVTLPEDTLVYKEGRKNIKEGFYLHEQGYRLIPSQFAGTKIIRARNGLCLMLLFELGKYIMEPLSYESIKTSSNLSN
jgi:hypothetical protein